MSRARIGSAARAAGGGLKIKIKIRIKRKGILDPVLNLNPVCNPNPGREVNALMI
jgi:hypothetical protein